MSSSICSQMLWLGDSLSTTAEQALIPQTVSRHMAALAVESLVSNTVILRPHHALPSPTEHAAATDSWPCQSFWFCSSRVGPKNVYL